MKFKGSVKEFDNNWKNSQDSKVEYWTRNTPSNQTQFAFRKLWLLFDKIIKKNKIKGKDVIEIGSGRGTISSYFADSGYNSYLLDSSKKAIDIAKNIFKKNNHKAIFFNNILNDFKIEKKFDIVFSIGLLEHFKNIDAPLKQQLAILKKNGIFLAYIVPDYKNQNVQKNYLFTNEILKSVFKSQTKKNKKKNIYRNNYNSDRYIKILKSYLKKISVYGVYPLPMISYSRAFPFTTLNKDIEKTILKEFNKIIDHRKKSKKFFDPWLCDEGYGQAFLIWGIKK